MRWKFFLVTLLFHSSHYDFAQALKATCSRSLTSHSYGEFPYRGEFHAGGRLCSPNNIYKSVYDTNFFISFFVRSICVINVLRIENRSKSLESACFSFKIHILHWKWTICCLKEKYGGLHE